MIKSFVRQVTTRAMEDVDLSSMALFRMFIGMIVFWSAARFLWNGWVDQFFAKPTYFFSFWGFSWIEVLPQPWMTVSFVLLAILGVMIATGTLYRVAVASALVLWTYVELIDVTNYLNHYVLVSVLLFSLLWMPAHRIWSVDQWRSSSVEPEVVPRWMVWVLRFQVISVYFWAGMAKCSSDWLIHAQPLNIWLMSRTDLPLIGGLFQHWPVALMMSWSGFLFDSTIWIFLLIRHTRPWAYVVVVCFHLMTGLLFNIGLFPFIMMGAATILFAPEWGRRFFGKKTRQPHALAPEAVVGPSRVAVMLVALYVLVQVLMPMRFLLYDGSVLWHEQGMRWSWRVMVREKNGAITYRVKWPGRARALQVSPSRYLTDHQVREMSGQPDMILQLGHHIGHQYTKEVGQPVQVYVDALVSLNGRPPARLIRQDVDLMTLEDGIAQASWILPMPTTRPARLVSVSSKPK